jgi:hypothetical protein
MNIKTKIVTALTLAVLVMPGISMAQTMSVAQLQAEIASLTAQLQSLEAQLAAGGGSTAWCYTFNSNLSIGMTGNAITALQTALQKDGESVTVNGTFDDQTASAVTAFQEKYQSQILSPYGLSYGTGYAGKSTRAELNSLFGCTSNNPVTPPIVITPIVPTSSPIGVACPMVVPYCPYGGHSVVESNGCSQEVCNQAPVQPVAPTSSIPGGSLTVTPNSSFTSMSVTPSTANQKIGSFIITNSQDGPVTLNSLTVQPGTNAQYMQNLKVLINGSSFGNIQPMLSSSGSYTLTGSASLGNPGQTTQLDIYADILASAPAGARDITSIAGCSATITGNPSYNGQSTTYSCPSTQGQTITFTGTTTAPTPTSTQQTPSITITAPASGAVWQPGQTYQIAWSSTAYPANTPVQILVYDTRYGQSVEPFAVSIPYTTTGAGSYSITIPAGAQPGTTYAIQADVVTSPLGLSSSAPVPFSVSATTNTSEAGLSATMNNALSNPINIEFGVASQKISSFVIANPSSVNPVNLESISIGTGANPSMSYLQNMVVKVNGSQFGPTQAALTGGVTYGFTATSPVVIPAGGSVVADVYADALTTAINIGGTTIMLEGASGTMSGGTSGVSLPAAVQGQSIAFAQG